MKNKISWFFVCILAVVSVILSVILILEIKELNLCKEESKEETKNNVKEIYNYLDNGEFYSMNLSGTHFKADATSILLGNYELNDNKKYNIAVHVEDKEFPGNEEDIIEIEHHYFVDVNHKSYEIPFKMTSIKLRDNYLFINGYDDNFYAACIFDLVNGKIVKNFKDGIITNVDPIVGDDWNNRTIYNVCENYTMYIRSFSMDDLNDDILLYTIDDVRCGQES